MYRVFEHSQVVLSGFQCMYAIHEASLQSHELYCDDPIRSSSTSIEIRNYLVANPMYINNELYETFLETSFFSSKLDARRNERILEFYM